MIMINMVQASESLPHLNINKDTVVGLVQHFVAFCMQRELKRDLGLASWDLSCLGHLDVAADQLDWLQHVTGMSNDQTEKSVSESEIAAFYDEEYTVKILMMFLYTFLVLRPCCAKT